MEAGTLAQWVGALGTFSAVAVALFKDDLVRLRRHPRLVAKIAAKHPYCVKTPFEHTDAGTGQVWRGSRYFLRFSVENTGRVRAEEVEVFLAQASEQDDNGMFRALPNFSPMNLRWSYSPLNPPKIYADGISPGMSRLCDFGAITEPSHPVMQALSEGGDHTRLALQLEALEPAANWLMPRKYKFKIRLAASNCEPVTSEVELHLTGLWSNDPVNMMSNGFVIREVS